MIKTLRLSFALRNTYRVNGILYGVRQIPGIKRILPASLYRSRGPKVFANVISVIWEVLSAFLGKFLYFLFLVSWVGRLFPLPAGTEAKVFLQMLLFLSLAGAVLNTYMFDPSKDKYYGMILLGMDAREYTLVNYFYAVFKVIAGFLFCSFLFGMPKGCSLCQCLLIPFFVAGVKLFVAACGLRDYEKKKIVRNEGKPGKYSWGVVAVFLALAYGLPAAGLFLPETATIVAMCLGSGLGLLSLYKILAFGSYRLLYKELLLDAPFFTIQTGGKATAKLQQEQNLKYISTDQSITSSRKGFEYLNELFIRRHRKILWRSAKRLALAVLFLTAGFLVSFRFVPGLKEGVNRMLVTSLPYFVFVMYLINRGTGFTSALFMNCDHSLLTYSFYKRPGFILKLFQIRLREIIKVNLLPAAVLGAGLILLLYASGGTKTPMDYGVLFVSVVCMSIFFSVHYLTLYYLLQPYNVGTEIKSGMYKVVTTVTYLASYVMIQVKLPIFFFGLMAIVFCILYCVAACILVYRFAPKTFRLRM